ncbi:pancreatic lipase-related protein 2 [Trichonephila clavipes]|nr:pancreatic lipase-related protein 2 [Trichonephila clavipes]
MLFSELATVPNDLLKSQRSLSRFYLFTPERSSDGVKLYAEDPRTFRFFNPRLETKIIIHGFLDKVKIADWMHGSRSDTGRAESGIFSIIPENDVKISIRNPDHCSVFRSELIAISGALDHALNSYKDSIWTLTDSRSSVQYLKNWPKIMDSIGLDILSKLVRLGQRKQVCLQWIPSHVVVPGSEAADELVGRGCDLPNPSSTVLTHSKIPSFQRNQMNLTSCSPLHMKDEFLILDDFNVIIVDWSFGNFIPYSKAAANTERVGEEISILLILLRDQYGARPEKFHLIGHSLGSHVAGYVGERVKGLKRITGLDPATYLFTTASPRAKLDRSDAQFVDVLHTDGGGIGMNEPVGHVDFYPNGGQIQPGCTTSNSLRALLEKGVVEGVRNVICSHMRAPHYFTGTINSQKCHHIGHRCDSWKAFSQGKCDSCGINDQDCAFMSYHIDTQRNYGNNSTFYLLTGDAEPYCGYEYKITLTRDIDYETGSRSLFRNVNAWPKSDILHISLYGSAGNADFQIEGNEKYKNNKEFMDDYLDSIISNRISYEEQARADRKSKEEQARLTAESQLEFERINLEKVKLEIELGKINLERAKLKVKGIAMSCSEQIPKQSKLR